MPIETPTSGGCDHCETITMATLPRLLRDVQRAFGVHTRIWLTEYGYQTNPPDKTIFGTSWKNQARWLRQAFQMAYSNPRIEMFLWFLVRDEPKIGGWQSGLETVKGKHKPPWNVFRSLPRG